ncbi:Myomesin-2 [Manis pentadactyla]|nr:Myomesin-2 [Manis pentadactyla]
MEDDTLKWYVFGYPEDGPMQTSSQITALRAAGLGQGIVVIFYLTVQSSNVAEPSDGQEPDLLDPYLEQWIHFSLGKAEKASGDNRTTASEDWDNLTKCGEAKALQEKKKILHHEATEAMTDLPHALRA